MENKILEIILTNLIIKRDMLEQDLKHALNAPADSASDLVEKVEAILKELSSTINMVNVWSSYLPPQEQTDENKEEEKESQNE